MWIKQCKELRARIRTVQHQSNPPSLPVSPTQSLASLQDRYSKAKQCIRQSAAVAIQAAWRGHKVRQTYMTTHRREMVAAASAAATDSPRSMELEPHTPQQPPVSGGVELPPSASERMGDIVSLLVRQREEDGKMRQAVETWAVKELEKERGLLKSLLMKESQARQQRRASSTPANAATEDSEMRAVFTPLYAHYRHLQSLLAKCGSGMKPQVPLFQSKSDCSAVSPSPTTSSATPLSSAHSAFSLVKPQPISPRAEKRALQVKLAEYTRQFTVAHGRAIQSALDIAPVKDDWARYKYLKFTLSEKGQSTAINGHVMDRVHRSTTPERRSGAAGDKTTASVATTPLGVTASSAFSSPPARGLSASSGSRSQQSSPSPATSSTLSTQPNTPSPPSTPPTPSSASTQAVNSLYASMRPFLSPSLRSSFQPPSFPSSRACAVPLTPPSPTSSYSLTQSHPSSPYSPYSPVSVGGTFGSHTIMYAQPLPFGAPVSPILPHYSPIYDGILKQPHYPSTPSGWCY